MPKYYPDNYGSVSVFLNVAGDPEPMVFTFDFYDTVGGASAASDLAGIRAQLAGAGKLLDAAFMRTIYSWTNTKLVKRIGSSMFGAENATLVQGTGTGTPPSNSLAVLTQKRGAALGRHNRGRMFLPPFMCIQTDIGSTGTVSAGVVSSVQGVMNTLLTNLNSAGLPMMILHQSSEIAPTPVTSLSVQSKAATQRRRMRP